MSDFIIGHEDWESNVKIQKQRTTLEVGGRNATAEKIGRPCCDCERVYFFNCHLAYHFDSHSKLFREGYTLCAYFWSVVG